MESTYSNADFGLVLQKLRTERGLTQEQLAGLIHKEKSIISRYENNYQSPTFDTVKALARIFNVSLDHLAGMEKRDLISAYNLTDHQLEIIKRLIAAFREQNSKSRDKFSPEDYMLMGEILEELGKQ